MSLHTVNIYGFSRFYQPLVYIYNVNACKRCKQTLYVYRKQRVQRVLSTTEKPAFTPKNPSFCSIIPLIYLISLSGRLTIIPIMPIKTLQSIHSMS
jgi:hypothetical protein